MTSTLQHYGLTWTDPQGIPRASAVGYDKPSAEHRRTELAAAGCTSIETVPIQPGQLPAPKG
ncbi:hypothetical protein ACIQPQ_31025 [Streptomyces sp. NPDC091281]|uniref:hypothetical protein n=1 Tax=Streptomyces sp. NPDC091281 TaxID=3365985 RepID=UPI0037F4DB70